MIAENKKEKELQELMEMMRHHIQKTEKRQKFENQVFYLAIVLMIITIILMRYLIQ